MVVVSLATVVVVVALVATVFLPWVADVRRVGWATSAREVAGRAHADARRLREADAVGGRRPPGWAPGARPPGAGLGGRRPSGARAFGTRPLGTHRAGRPLPPPARPPAMSTEEARHRAVLGLGSGPVTAAVLRRQYRRLVALHHPDHAAGRDAAAQARAAERTVALNQAYAWFKARLPR